MTAECATFFRPTTGADCADGDVALAFRCGAAFHCHNPRRRRSSAAANGVSSSGATFQVAKRPWNQRARSSVRIPSRNSAWRRERPGQGSDQHRRGRRRGLGNHRHAVLRHDDRVRQAQHAEIRDCPRCRPRSRRPAAPASRRSTRTASGSVRREGVTASPTRSRCIIPAERAGKLRGHRGIQPDSGRCCHRSARRPAAAAGGRTGRAKRRRRRPGAPGVARCSAVRVTTTLGPVSPSWRLTTTRSKRRGSRRGCCTCTTARPPRRSAAATAAPMPPQAMTSPGSGPAERIGHRGQRPWPELRRHPFPGRPRGQGAQFMRQAGGLGQADRLRLQAGQRFAQDQGRGGVRHGTGFSARRGERSNKDDAG